jgi:hypothetical protein
MFSGSQLAQLLSSLVSALNEKEIPTSASLIEAFNRELISKSLDAYNSKVEAVQLPLEEEKLQQVGAGW